MTMTTTSSIRILTGVAIGVAAALGFAGRATADPPVDLDPGQITDRAGALDEDGREDVEQALDRLLEEDDVQLFVVYVDSFDGMDSQEWADETASRNGLGLNDALLAVAVGDRQYAYSVDEDFPIDEAELRSIAAEQIEPELIDDDWSGAGVAAADGFREAVGNGDDGGGAGWLVPVLVVGALAVGGWFLYRRFRSKSAAGPTAPAEAKHPLDGLSEDELAQRGSSLLVEVDDAITTSEVELNVAEVEFGPVAAAPFREALTAARAEIQAAFTARIKLDDDEVAEADRRAVLVEVIERAEKADALLDAQADAFAELRDRATRAPELLAALAPKLAASAARLAQAETTMAGLTATYPVSALGEVADNATEARQRIEFARTQVQEGGAAVAAGDTGKAAVSTRAAEQAIEQVGTLLDAIDRAGAELEQARAALPGRLDSLRQDLAEADAAGPTSGAAVTGAAAVARQLLAEIEPKVADPGLDPVGTVARLTEAEAKLDEALAPARDQRARHDRARTLLTEALAQAETRVAAVQDYITTRRGAVGPEARTRISEAARKLAEAKALAQSDPEAAVSNAEQARALADQAAQLADADVTDYQRAPYGGAGGGGGGGGFGNLGGMVLGGILLDSILRSSRGGGYGGGGGGFGGGGRGGGGASPGSFGGSGRRRGGSGRF